MKSILFRKAFVKGAGCGLLVLAATFFCRFAVAQSSSPVTIRCPQNIVVECQGTRGTPVTFTVTATNGSGPVTNITCTPPSGSVFPAGTTTVNCMAIDELRNTASCSFTVTVTNDITKPILVLPDPITVPCLDSNGAFVTFTVTARDNCTAPITISSTPPSGSLFPIGTTTVACTATDAAGNASSGTFDVTVSGQCGNCLQISCPTNVLINLGSGRGIVYGPFGGPAAIPVHYDVPASNLCTGSNLLLNCEPPSGSLFTVGTHVVNCYAVDGVARAVCSFQVRVTDSMPPKITVPRSVYASCNEKRGDGSKGATVSFTVKATDNGGPPTLVCTPPAGSFFAIGRTVVECVATDGSGNKATNHFTVNVTESLYCSLKTSLEDLPDNWGFELGLTAWAPEGDAFTDQPVEGDRMPVKRVNEVAAQIKTDLGGDYWQDITYPVGHKGDHWVGTAEDINALPGGLFEDAPTDQRTGTLRSKSFMIEKPYISFLIGGTEDAARLRVELLVEADAFEPGTEIIDGLPYKPWAFFTGHNREAMRWEQFAVFSQVGKRAVIRIVDNSTTGHLNVDDFLFEDTPRLFQTVKVGGETYPAWIKHEDYFYRWDSPVWGFADMHTHPMSYLGFGGAVLRGRPDGNISDALENCRCFHDIPPFEDLGCGDFMRGLVMHVMEDGVPNTHGNGYSSNPYAQFNAWPVFWTIAHQQMWHEWMKRAHDGGLRVIIALCVNNPMLAVGAKGEKGTIDDKFVSDVQIEGLTNFVSRHSSFMEIALDPFQLRDIVRRGKLAVIIGSELDDIGNFARNGLVHQWHPDDPWEQPSDGDKKKVRDEIERLYNKGVRYMFPVHLMNNSFGGTAVGNDMLNVANKFLNHEGFEIEPGITSDNINLYLKTLDFTDEAAAVTAGAAAAPLIIPLVLPFADLFLGSLGVPPGTAGAVGAGILPLAIMGTTALPIMGIELNEDGIPLEVLPLFHSYPTYPQKGDSGWSHGHKNKKGLTPLGDFAIREMMRRGIMIDIDHMSQKMVGQVFKMATNNPMGYPLNSGHNSPREMGLERGENGRTLDHFQVVASLGGIFGVGWENSEAHDFNAYAPSHDYTHSDIANDCAGTTKTFAQNYLYGVEAMRARGVALGTDIDGLITAPGPRFGPQSGFALKDDKFHERRDQVLAQDNGVLYSPEKGNPITTPVFLGRAIDFGVDAGYPRTQLGYAYNIEQGDIFAAIGIYYWARQAVQDGPVDPGAGEAAIKPVLQDVVNAGAYANRGRVLLFALGMLRGIHDWPVTSDLLDGNVEAIQKLGKALYDAKVAELVPLPQYVNTSDLKPRFERAVQVWHHYHRIFGGNIPLKRCQTHAKQWDINFEGVAHYGLVPDFLQDLSNVGMDPDDLSVLFRSAEHVAQMWTRTLNAANALSHPYIHLPVTPIVLGGSLNLEWFAEFGDQLEETDDLGDSSSWHLSSADVRIDDDRARATTPIDGSSSKPRFFRVRKP